jgi:hypothetical protein
VRQGGGSISLDFSFDVVPVLFYKDEKRQRGAMQGHSGAAARSSGQSAGAKSLRLLINPPRLHLDDRTVIFKYTGDGGWFCASFGDGAKYMRAAKEDPVLRRRIDARAQHLRRHRDALGPDLARVMAAVELAKDYDPNQARDELGRWTSEGGGVAAGTVADALSLYGAQNAVPALRALAQRALAAGAALLPEGAAAIGVAATGSVAVLGTLFLPLNRGSGSTGTLPDAPEFSYKYDQDTGRLTVTRQNDDGTTETVFSGHHDKDAVFRDENGNAIGRFLGDSVALDADAVRGYEARRKSDAQAPPGAIVQSTARTRDDPEACPAPESDKPGYKNERAIAYEEHVGEVVGGVVPPGLGLAIRMTKLDGDPIYLDNCVDETHSLIEAKGFDYGVKYEKWITTGDDKPWQWYENDMMNQAASQVEVAREQGWNLEWHFADEKVANYMRGKFGEKGYPIKVFYTPPTQDMTQQFGRVLEGSSDERQHLPGLRAWR